MEKKIEEIVHAFGEEMERIVFNSNGKAKTMDLAKAWLRGRLEELVQETRAEFDGCDEIEIGKEGFSQELKTCPTRDTRDGRVSEERNGTPVLPEG
jgi:hypothetical protein